MSKKLAIVAALFGSSMAAPAMAAPIITGQWYTFRFDGLGSALAAGTGVTLGTNPASIAAPAAPWTFTLNGPGTLTIVDGFNSGDQFALTDFGAALGTTSAPVTGGNCGSDITLCLASPAQSKGVFALSAGSHSLAGTVVASFGSGAGFFLVSDTAVPEPATWAMMIAGFGVAGAAMRRRQKVSVRVAYAA